MRNHNIFQTNIGNVTDRNNIESLSVYSLSSTVNANGGEVNANISCLEEVSTRLDKVEKLLGNVTQRLDEISNKMDKPKKD